MYALHLATTWIARCMCARPRYLTTRSAATPERERGRAFKSKKITLRINQVKKALPTRNIFASARAPDESEKKCLYKKWKCTADIYCNKNVWTRAYEREKMRKQMKQLFCFSVPFAVYSPVRWARLCSVMFFIFFFHFQRVLDVCNRSNAWSTVDCGKSMMRRTVVNDAVDVCVCVFALLTNVDRMCVLGNRFLFYIWIIIMGSIK